MKFNSSLIFASLLLRLGLSASAATTRYVDVNNASPVSPYTTWVMAATNIQDAIDLAVPGDDIVVTNGVYQTGARAVYGMSNRVAVTKAVTVWSINGPAVTSIVGSGPLGDTAVRCVYLTNGAVLSGFTLTNGATQVSGDTQTNQSGGGVWCESETAVLTNCVLTGNSAYAAGGAYLCMLNNCTLTGNSAVFGGGTYYGTLINCTLTGNSAEARGGGAYYGTLMNCTLTGNSASSGGGVNNCTLSNCTLTGNSAEWGGATFYEWHSNCTLNNCTLSGNSAIFGGGTYYGTLNNCTLSGNSAEAGGGGACNAALNNCTLTGNSAAYGGGVNNCTLNNCTLTGNSAEFGGGADHGTLNNCIVYYNTASSSYANCDSSLLSYCCTTPLASGPGNFSSEPGFVNTNGWTNLRLQAGSPCINAGTNAYAPGLIDLDGNPRIFDGTVDVGAYEVQFPNVTPPYVLGVVALADGSIQFAFTNRPGAGFSVLGTTNVALPSSNWTVLGSAFEGPPGHYQFTEPAPLTNSQRFYRVRSP